MGLHHRALRIVPDGAEDRANVMRWLDEQADHSPHWVGLIRYMLDQPRLPEEPATAALEAMTLAHTRRRGGSQLIGLHDAEQIYRELRAHLIEPDRAKPLRTKETEVWHVESAIMVERHGILKWIPVCAAYLTKEEAHEAAQGLAAAWVAVRVTGPHTQLVPAD